MNVSLIGYDLLHSLYSIHLAVRKPPSLRLYVSTSLRLYVSTSLHVYTSPPLHLPLSTTQMPVSMSRQVTSFKYLEIRVNNASGEGLIPLNITKELAIPIPPGEWQHPRKTSSLDHT